MHTVTWTPAGIGLFEMLNPVGQVGDDPATVSTFVPDLHVIVLDGELAPGLFAGAAEVVGFGVVVGFL